MTTICTYRTDDKITVIGDTNYVEENKNYQGQSKLIKLPHKMGIISFCGSARIGTLLAEKSFEMYEYLREFEIQDMPYIMASYLKNIITEDGTFIGENSDNSEELRGFTILAIIGNEVWIFDAFFSVMIIQENFFSLGSGSDYAYGAFYILNKAGQEIDMHEIMKAVAHNDRNTKPPFIVEIVVND